MLSEPRAGRPTYASLFLVALATLTYEVLLTRIFSVTMFYHFAFVAVSVALFGMTVGAVIVYLFPRLFTPDRAHRAMAVNALLFGVTTLLTFVAHLKQENAALRAPEGDGHPAVNPLAFTGTYALISVPFVFSGVAVCLALTRFPRQVSRLYAADLAGAAIGCVLFVLALRVTDGPTVVCFCATLAVLAAVCAAVDAGCRKLIAITTVVFVAAATLTGVNGYLNYRLDQARLENLPRTAALALRGRYVSTPPPIRIEHAKGSVERPALFEAWNPFSRIRVRKEEKWLEPREPSGWGMSPKYKDDPSIPNTTREMVINIDAGAGTYMTHFYNDEALHLIELALDRESQRLFHYDEAYNARARGDQAEAARHAKLEAEEADKAKQLRDAAAAKAVEQAKIQAGFLKYDVTNFAHFLRPDSTVLVIGSGGGRDILSALAFGQKHVTGVEINEAIIAAMKKVFGDFTGHLDRLPNVKIVHDEARSYITRMPEKVDVIQISLIDTWAATAAGAFVLSENSLYTVEAWRTFFNHLTDRGVLTVSRWYHPATPGETLRAVSLANQALREIGVADPRKHILVVKRHQPQMSKDVPSEVASLIVSKSPLTDADLTTARQQAEHMGFDLILTPASAATKELADFAGSPDAFKTADAYAINLAPPTDDKPFFFNMTRMSDAFNPAKWQGQGHDVNLKAVQVVAGLLVFVILLTLVTVIAPVLLKAEKGSLKGSGPLTAFFFMIGLAFLLVEISQMQRLIILLGHPTYSLSVVLFAVLVSSGIGSYLTRNVEPADAPRAVARRMTALLVILIVTGLLTPLMIRSFVSSATPVRITVALLLLMPAGLFMGMCFPLGMKLAAGRKHDITPWLWAINGAMSVIASVLCIVLAMSFGISAAWWVGVGCYAVGLFAVYPRAKSITPGQSVGGFTSVSAVPDSVG